MPPEETAAAAARINLTAADLPDFASPTDPSQAPGRSTLDRELARCLGTSTGDAGGVGTGIPDDQRTALFGMPVERTAAHAL